MPALIFQSLYHQNQNTLSHCLTIPRQRVGFQNTSIHQILKNPPIIRKLQVKKYLRYSQESQPTSPSSWCLDVFEEDLDRRGYLTCFGSVISECVCELIDEFKRVDDDLSLASEGVCESEEFIDNCDSARSMDDPG